MASKATKNQQEDLTPADIVIDDDSDMPEPATKKYTEPAGPTYKLTEKFLNLFNSCLQEMPYASTLQNQQGNKIKLIDLIRFVDTKKDNMPINDLNTVLGFVAAAPFKYVRPLMEIVEQQNRQGELFNQI